MSVKGLQRNQHYRIIERNGASLSFWTGNNLRHVIDALDELDAQNDLRLDIGEQPIIPTLYVDGHVVADLDRWRAEKKYELRLEGRHVSR